MYFPDLLYLFIHCLWCNCLELTVTMENLPTEQTNEEIDFYKISAERAAEAASYISSEFADDSDDADDEIFNNIQKSVVSANSDKNLVYGDGSVATVDRTGNGASTLPVGAHNSLTYGFIPKGCYTHPIKNGALHGSEYHF